MNKKTHEKALLSLDKARTALHDHDVETAREHALIAIKQEADLEEAWLILSSISDPKDSIEYLNRALEINPQSQKARKGMRWAVNRLRKDQQEAVNQKKLPPKNNKEQGKFSNRWAISLFLSITAIGSVLIFWFGLPTLQAQASVQKEPRPEDALPKPTLTPTVTPTPTQTPTPTPTLTPTPTATADTDFSSYYYHSWDIPEEVSGSNDFWIEIDLGAQMLYAYRGSQILGSFYISSGTSSHPTVTGTYKIYAKHPTYTMIGPGYNLPDVPYSMFFYKGYSIHGTYWHSNFGTPMSHGCVNMNTNDAAWVYNQSTIGTYVFVHN
ncbi:MAG: L,D-transpeptidase [Pelolinea sp.]|nr:L,D-transpeptidase [Pelolinea sp.]